AVAGTLPKLAPNGDPVFRNGPAVELRLGLDRRLQRGDRLLRGVELLLGQPDEVFGAPGRHGGASSSHILTALDAIVSLPGRQHARPRLSRPGRAARPAMFIRPKALVPL